MDKMEELLDALGDAAEQDEHEEDDGDDNEEDTDEGEDEDDDNEEENDDDDDDDDVIKDKKVSHEKLFDNSQQLEIIETKIDETIKESAKLEAKIDQLKETAKPDMKAFEGNIRAYISDDEYEARLDDDPSVFLNAVERAREKFREEHGKSAEIEKLVSEFTKLQKQKENFTAIKEVTKLYPDFDFNEAQTFYAKKMTGEQQEKVTSAKTPKDGLIILYKMLKKLPIKRIDAPKKPQLDSVKKRSGKGEDIGLKQVSKKYYEDIGLGEGY